MSVKPPKTFKQVIPLCLEEKFIKLVHSKKKNDAS